MRVQGQVVVVTGGGSGIGSAMARRFAAEGARAVVVADLQARAADEVAAQCTGAEGRCVGHSYVIDVGDAQALQALIAHTEAEVGPIGLFCSNAGLGVRPGSMTSEDTWQRLWEVHVMAHVVAAEALLPRMLARGGGWLLATASAAGLLSQFDAPYAVTKHAAVAYAEWLSIKYGDQGLGVSCLCPGTVDTPMLRAEAPQRREAMANGLPPMAPETVADIVVQALAEERFLILPHPEIGAWLQHKAADPQRWIRGMRRMFAGH